jgi:hypothetical protein
MLSRARHRLLGRRGVLRLLRPDLGPSRSVDGVQFSRELRGAVARGEITVSIRRWSRPQVRTGARYTTAGVVLEIDSIEVMPFSAVSDEDVRASGEADREALRARAAHSGPIDDDTVVHRVEFHVV